MTAENRLTALEARATALEVEVFDLLDLLEAIGNAASFDEAKALIAELSLPSATTTSE